jgi:hypothetical protein
MQVKPRSTTGFICTRALNGYLDDAGPHQHVDSLLPSRLAAKLCHSGLTKHRDGIAAGGILRRAVHGNYVNPLADAVKLDDDVIVGAGNS